MTDLLEQADAAYADRSWAQATDAYAAADAEAALPPDALERWGLAAFLTGQDDASDEARERAHHGYVATGDIDGAARVGVWLGITLSVRGEWARSGGWFGRVQALLDEHGVTDSVWHLFIRLASGMELLLGGNPSAAADYFRRLFPDTRRFDSPDLYVAIRNGLGQALVRTGHYEEGLRLLDEVMLEVTSNDRVSPQFVGLMYCGGIATIRCCFDLRRAHEWTAALSKWCARQPELVPYRGQCLVHRAEVLQLHGSWSDAHDEVERVFRELGHDPADRSAGLAHYQRGELHRLRGELAIAEESYRKASRCGHDPQPGLALLRLMQGNTDAACGAIRRAVDETTTGHERYRLLPAMTEIALAADDASAARSAVHELQSGAEAVETPWLVAAAAHAAGQVAEFDGDLVSALRSYRQALDGWQRIAAPYEAARTRVRIAQVCRELDDCDTADLELDAARWTFEQLGAKPDLDRLEEALRPAPASAPPGGLTPRETEVLRLVATGATNRRIAGELFLSEKTVARHVANIFLKLGVTTRAAATAYAFEHRLV